MHIVSRRNMLALPVERLVGSGNHSHGHRARPPMVMSPDSSASDSSNSDSPTPNAKVFSSYATQLLTNNTISNNGGNNNPNQNNGRRSQSPVPVQIQTPPTSLHKSVSVSNHTHNMNNNNTTTNPANTNNNCIISSTTSSDEPEVKIKTSCSPTPSPTGIGYSNDEGGSGSSDEGCHEDPFLSTSGTVEQSKKNGMLSSGKERERTSRNRYKGDGMEIQLTVHTKKEEEGGGNCIENGGCGGIGNGSSKKRRNSSDDNREGNKIYRNNNRDGVECGSGTSATASPVVGESPESSEQKMTIRLIENDHIDVDDMVDVDVNLDTEPKPRSRNNSLSQMNNDNDNVLDDSSDENNSICGRPPSRPPSSASSTVTSASTICTFPLSPSSESPSPIKGSIAMITRPHRPQPHHHHHSNTNTHPHASHINSISHSLKFSIDDILRPEFGKVAIQRISRRPSSNGPHSPHHHHHHRRSSANNPNANANTNANANANANATSFSGEFPESQYSSNHHRNLHQPHLHHQHQQKHHMSHSPHSHTSSNSNSVDSNGVGSQSQSQRLGRPSSVKDHSEDSNSSCTSRKEEVVDETKVNPKVPQGPLLWPAWVYCTRYSDRPSSGPRSRRVRKPETPGVPKVRETPEEKRPRTAFTAEQLARLKQEFDENRYLTERRRQDLARDLKLHENQIKIWFQNKRAKLKKSTGTRGSLAIQLMNQGLYNHSTVPIDEDDEMYEAMMQQQ